MLDSIDHHADMLRQAIALGGAIEIQEVGTDSSVCVPAGDLLTTPLNDRTAYHAIRRARSRTLLAAAAINADVASVGQKAVDEASIILAAWARSLADIEARGGQISYRGNA